MKLIEDRLHDLMDRLDYEGKRIQPTDKLLVFEAIQRLRCAYKDIRQLKDECEDLQNLRKDSERLDWLLERGIAWKGCYTDKDWQEGEWLYGIQDARSQIDAAMISPRSI